MTTPISRRTLIKGGAIVGGTVWVAPAIESFTYKAAAASVNPTGGPPPGCPPFGAYGLSGLTILYIRGGVLYWTFIGQGETTCDAGGGSISNDDSFTTTCGANVLRVNTPSAGVTWNNVAPINDTTCYFAATAGGADVTAAGIAAGVTVVAWIAHNGTFVGGTPLGPKGHFEVECGTPSGECPTTPFAGR